MECPHCNKPISTRFLKKWDEILNLMDQGRRSVTLHRVIAGGLRQAIHDHGPITPEWIGSATKRVYVNLRNYRRQILRDEKDRYLRELSVVPSAWYFWMRAMKRRASWKSLRKSARSWSNIQSLSPSVKVRATYVQPEDARASFHR